MGVFIGIETLQSEHARNNAQVVETKWFPGKSKNLSDAGFIQGTHQIYNVRNNIKDIDFYFSQ